MFPPGRGRCRLGGMKAAAFFALLIAVIIGAYTVADFLQNHQQRSVFENASQLALASGRLEDAADDSHQIERMQDAERGDIFLAIFAAGLLIAGIVIASQSNKSASSYPVAQP